MEASLHVRIRASRAFAAMLVVAALTALVSGCKSKPAPPPDAAVFGPISPSDDVDFLPYLDVARAIAMHAARPEVTVPPAPGKRAFVTLWSAGEEPVVGSGKGDTLMASVVAAAEEAAKRAPPNPRVQIDVIGAADPVSLEPGTREDIWRLGLRGYVVSSGPGNIGFVSPGEVTAQKYFDSEGEKEGTAAVAIDRLRATLAGRAGVDQKTLTTLAVYAVTTTSRLDSSPPGRAVALYRGIPPGPSTMSVADLTEATRAGADYLVRVIDDKGHYQYVVKAVDASVDKGYGWLRHAGLTYALLEAFGELGNPLYLEKARLALVAIKSKMRSVPDVGAYLRDLSDEEQQKVGGAGLAIIAFAKFHEITGERLHLEAMRALARLIVHQQYPDGHFRANIDVEHEDPEQKGKLKTEVTYYAGEALLGLMRAYAIDPQASYLETAKKGADYLINVRDAGKDEDHLTHDHWLAYALNELYRATKNPKYAEHAFKIARAILKGDPDLAKAHAPDMVSSFYVHGESTPTATRLEAVAAIMELSRAMGKDHAWLDAPAMRYAAFLKHQQFDRDSVYFTRAPSFFIGGVRESLLVGDVRIDFVQHAMSGWIHLMRLLRDPRYGAEIVPPRGAPSDAGVDAAK